MEPREAARLLTLALEKATDAIERYSLAQGLAAVARRLSQEDAARFCHPVMQKFLQVAENETDESERQILSKAVASLLSASDDIDASHVSAKLASAICSGRDANCYRSIDDSVFPPVFSSGSESLDALLTDDSRSKVSRRTVAAGTVLGLGSVTPLAALRALPAVREPLPCRLPPQDLVELLKMPTCYGPARKVVLKHLGNRYGRTFANHWEFVRYAQEQQLDLDFLSPPKRPKRQ
jgi:hypothetical protein